MITYKDIKNDEEVLAYLKKGDNNLAVMGFTDHSAAHTSFVAKRAGYLLESLGYTEHDVELVKIAGFMHDIGNAINRTHHAEYGALLANDILKTKDISLEDRVTICTAIANHDESTGGAVDYISAALIIADKTDVRRSRVREHDKNKFDIHDRVNYAVTESNLHIKKEKQVIQLDLTIDESIVTMYEYFDIFLDRMVMCRGAAEMLGQKFKMTSNGNKIF